MLGARPRAELDEVVETADAASIARLAGVPQPLPGLAGVLVGHGALVVLWGVPGGGKSTLAARVLDATPGPVLYVSIEEGLGPTLAGRLARLGIARRDYYLLGRATVDQVVAELRRRRAVAVAIDSVQASTWEPRELRHLLAVLPALRFIIAISQVNAKGLPEGRRALTHEADLALRVEGMRATITKSRYQELTHGETDLSVLPRAAEARNTVRCEEPPLSHLRLVRGANLPEGGGLDCGSGAAEPTR
jgi:hypothetical protein